MVAAADHLTGGPIRLVASPLHLSHTPVRVPTLPRTPAPAPTARGVRAMAQRRVAESRAPAIAEVTPAAGGRPRQEPAAPPVLGQHTDAVLHEVRCRRPSRFLGEAPAGIKSPPGPPARQAIEACCSVVGRCWATARSASRRCGATASCEGTTPPIARLSPRKKQGDGE